MKHYFENDKLSENIFLTGLMYAQQLPVTTEPIPLHASDSYEIGEIEQREENTGYQHRLKIEKVNN